MGLPQFKDFLLIGIISFNESPQFIAFLLIGFVSFNGSSSVIVSKESYNLFFWFHMLLAYYHMYLVNLFN